MNTTNGSGLNQGRLVHELQRRVRIIAPVFRKDAKFELYPKIYIIWL